MREHKKDICANCEWCEQLMGEECGYDGREIYSGEEAIECRNFSLKEEYEEEYDECRKQGRGNGE